MNLNQSTRRGRRLIVATSLAMMLTAASGACSDESPSRGASRGGSTSTPRAEAPRDAAHGNHVEVTAVDFAFEGLPSNVKPGTRLTLHNEAERELHELVAFRLPDHEKRTVKELTQLPASEMASLLAKPTTVLLAAPGADQIAAVGNGTLTEPGRYLVMCAIPTGVDPAEYLAAAAAANGEKPNVAGGMPHFLSGMVSEVTVG